jgi:glycosyltransferase involved in cell wall biosynthesis
MKILLTHFQIQDYGGIVNYSECLAKGLLSLDHSVDAVMLKNKGITGKPKSKDRELDAGWEESCIADWMHQKSGWEGMRQLNYVKDKEEAFTLGDNYDLIIHIVPVPTCAKATKEDTHWKDVFEELAFSNCKQIAVIHDGNMQKLYPHILSIVDHLDGLVCVHDASFNSCNVLPVRRTFIPNPHNFEHSREIPSVQERREGLVSLQTFKRWKRVDDLIKAMQFMDSFTEKVICGGGIEYHYMTSETKCKKEYTNEDGSKIWDVAVNNGMEYLGYVTTEERDELLKSMRLLVDPSWSKSYSQFGSHFNRVMIEAMSWGCVPVCTDLGMNNSLLFKPGINYLEIPYDCSSEFYGKQLDEWILDEELLSSIQSNNLKLMQVFEKSTVAKAIIEFAFGESGEVGEPTQKLIEDADRKMNHFEGL